MSDPDPPADGQGRDVPGDTGAGDIVGPTGEEMPLADHDDVHVPRRPRAAAPRQGNAVPTKGSGLPR